MGWVDRLFGKDQAQAAPAAVSTGKTWAEINNQPETSTPSNEPIPPERVGLHGEYDQSGLAKRVALAFDQDPTLDDINTVFVFQTGGTVVLKGKAPSQAIISKMVDVAKTVKGATAVETNEITVG